MSLAEPKHPEAIEESKRISEALRRAHTHGAMWPDGRITEHFCPPPEKGVIGHQSGDTPLLWMNGRVQVVDRWARKGVRLFEDVCASDGVPELYPRWREAIAHRGKISIRNYTALYPPTVHRLRRESETGHREDVVFDGEQGLIKATPDAVANRVADLVDSAGIGRPTKADRVK